MVPACNMQSSSDDLNKPLDQSWNSNVLRIRQDAGAALNKVVNFFRGDPQEKPGATCPTKSTPPLDKGSSPDPQMIKIDDMDWPEWVVQCHDGKKKFAVCCRGKQFSGTLRGAGEALQNVQDCKDCTFLHLPVLSSSYRFCSILDVVKSYSLRSLRR